MKRSAGRKDTFDCVIRLKQISPQLLFVLSEQINSVIKSQLKNYDGWVTITSDISQQLQDVNQLIQLREELLNEIVKK